MTTENEENIESTTQSEALDSAVQKVESESNLEATKLYPDEGLKVQSEVLSQVPEDNASLSAVEQGDQGIVTEAVDQAEVRVGALEDNTSSSDVEQGVLETAAAQNSVVEGDSNLSDQVGEVVCVNVPEVNSQQAISLEIPVEGTTQEEGSNLLGVDSAPIQEI